VETDAGFHRRQPRRRQGTLKHAGSWLALALAISTSAPSAAESLHLLGFVKSLCVNETYCFELRVKPEFIEQAGEYLKVRFDTGTRIFDPENYELTLEQQNIVAGSHLRLLLEGEASAEVNGYRAAFIWIGD
jgi:hypothetical protein